MCVAEGFNFLIKPLTLFPQISNQFGVGCVLPLTLTWLMCFEFRVGVLKFCTCG